MLDLPSSMINAAFCATSQVTLPVAEAAMAAPLGDRSELRRPELECTLMETRSEGSQISRFSRTSEFPTFPKYPEFPKLAIFCFHLVFFLCLYVFLISLVCRLSSSNIEVRFPAPASRNNSLLPKIAIRCPPPCLCRHDCAHVRFEPHGWLLACLLPCTSV